MLKVDQASVIVQAWRMLQESAMFPELMEDQLSKVDQVYSLEM